MKGARKKISRYVTIVGEDKGHCMLLADCKICQNMYRFGIDKDAPDLDLQYIKQHYNIYHPLEHDCLEVTG